MKLTKKKWNGDPSADRDKFIGGSDIGTIMGLNPWKSAYTLWAEKTGRIQTEDISNKESVWWGTNMEDLVAKRFAMKYEESTGEKVKLYKPMVSYSIEEYPYFIGHVDRLFRGKKIGLECKTTSSRNRTNYREGEIPPMHYCQCQFYMLVTGYKEWYLATKRDNEFYITKTERNDEYIEEIIESAVAFWQMVQKDIEPEIDDSESTAETINQMYPESIQEVVDLSDYRQTIESRMSISDQIKSLESIRRECDSVIKATMGEAEKGICDGFTVTWKSNARGIRPLVIKRK